MTDQQETDELGCSVYRARIEFLERTLQCYKSLPMTLAGTFDVSECSGNCKVLRDNFLDVWSINAGLNKRVEADMARCAQTIRHSHSRIAELETLNGHLEQCVSRLGAQLDEKQQVVEGCPPRLGDLEEYFARKLDDSASTVAVMQERILDLRRALHLKEQESAARQLQISHMLALPNQLEHASEVNRMRTRLREAEKEVKELRAQPEQAEAPAAKGVVPRVDLQQDAQLAQRLGDFFALTDRDGPPSDANAEERLCSQFLLDQPKLELNRLKTDSYTRGEAIGAMRRVCGDRKRTACRQQDFAACLTAMGGRFRLKRGLRYWVNVVVRRRPMFTWDV